MKLERLYTVPLGKAINVAMYRRTPRAVKILRQFIARHMKQEDERITISAALNDSLWRRSIKKPPKRVKVRLIKDAGFIRAYLADEKVAEEKKEAAGAKKEEKKGETPAAKPQEAPKAEAGKGQHRPSEAHGAHGRETEKK